MLRKACHLEYVILVKTLGLPTNYSIKILMLLSILFIIVVSDLGQLHWCTIIRRVKYSGDLKV
jgi:hypothetical protein